MTIAIRGSTPATATSSTATVAVTLTTTRQPQAGDKLIIIHSNDWYALADMPTPTVGGSTTGVNAITSGSFDGGSFEPHGKSYYYDVASTGDLTVSVTETSAGDEEKSLAVYVLSGAATGAVDAAGTSVNTAGGTTSETAPSISPTQTDSYLICHVSDGNGGNSAPYTPPSGMAETYDLTLASAYGAAGAVLQLSASGATGTKTFTSTAGAHWGGLSIAVTTAAGGAANTDNPTLQHPMSVLPAPLQSPQARRSATPPIALLVWVSEDSVTAAAAAEIGAGAAAVVGTATETKVAVQSGSCTAGASGTAVEKKVGAESGAAAAAAAAGAVEKKVAVQVATVAAAPVGVAAEVRVVAQAGVSTAAVAGTAVHTTGVPAGNTDDPTLQAIFALSPPINEVPRFASTWDPGFARRVWAGQDDPSIPTALESGSAAVAPAGTAVEKKVAVQSGSCTAGAAGTSAEKKVAPERGVVAGAAAGTSVETSGSVAIEKGTISSAAAVSSTEKKVAVQGGSCSAGAAAASTSKKIASSQGHSGVAAAATGVCRKIGKASGAVAVGACLYSTQSKRVAQLGRTCAAPTVTSSFTLLIPTLVRVSTGQQTLRSSTGHQTLRVSTGFQTMRVTAGLE